MAYEWLKKNEMVSAFSVGTVTFEPFGPSGPGPTKVSSRSKTKVGLVGGGKKGLRTKLSTSHCFEQKQSKGHCFDHKPKKIKINKKKKTFNKTQQNQIWQRTQQLAATDLAMYSTPFL